MLGEGGYKLEGYNLDKMKIAYLNNHSAVCKFILQLAKTKGAQVYLPLICPENGGFSMDAARASRTLHISELDDLDIYSSTTPTPLQMSKLNSLDLVIIPGAVRSRCLLAVAQTTLAKTCILEWGDINNTPVHHEWNSALTRKNVNRAVCYKYLDTNAFLLPLGYDFSSLASFTTKRASLGDHVCLIASRLGHGSYSLPHVEAMLECLSSQKLKLVIMGKEISRITGSYLASKYSTRWQGIAYYSDLDQDSFYSMLATSQALLYWITEPTVLQYSAIEANYLDVPIIYSTKSLIAKYLDHTDPLRICLNKKYLAEEILIQHQGQILNDRVLEGLENWDQLLSGRALWPLSSVKSKISLRPKNTLAPHYALVLIRILLSLLDRLKRGPR
jgi:hypothetical protein